MCVFCSEYYVTSVMYDGLDIEATRGRCTETQTVSCATSKIEQSFYTKTTTA